VGGYCFDQPIKMKMILLRNKTMIRKATQSLLLIITLVLGVFFINPTATLAESSVQVASIFSFSGEQPNNLGLKNGQLAKCPETPNCVSSQSKDDSHQIEPLTYESSSKEAFSKLKKIIEETDNAEIIEDQSNYLYAQYTSQIMGFVDDVEFYLKPEEQLIHVRSASRLGESDLGVNRDRIETIREQF
jgi:uncharacterized protein (DUF1499 family)